MGKVVKGISDAIGLTDSREGARAVRKGADQQVAAQREALDYLKEREAVPQQFREGALGMLGGLYGLQGGDPMAMSRMQGNPIYQATLGQLPQQEEAILRNQSATGALRSGGTDMMLAENQRQNQLSAIQNTMGGLQGLASLPSNANQIAGATAGIGQTQRQGTIGYTQSKLSGEQAAFDEMMGLGQLGMAAFSDGRLKDNLEPAGSRNGHNWYTWTWNDEAVKFGLYGEADGVLAQEIAATNPDAVGLSNGYLTVDYGKLGVSL